MLISNVHFLKGDGMTIMKYSDIVSDFSEKKINKSSSREINKWEQTLISENASIQCAISTLDQAAMQIVIVVDKEQKLIGTITDGDIRMLLWFLYQWKKTSFSKSCPQIVYVKFQLLTKIGMLLGYIHGIVSTPTKN